MSRCKCWCNGISRDARWGARPHRIVVALPCPPCCTASAPTRTARTTAARRGLRTCTKSSLTGASRCRAHGRCPRPIGGLVGEARVYERRRLPRARDAGHRGARTRRGHTRRRRLPRVGRLTPRQPCSRAPLRLARSRWRLVPQLLRGAGNAAGGDVARAAATDASILASADHVLRSGQALVGGDWHPMMGRGIALVGVEYAHSRLFLCEHCRGAPGCVSYNNSAEFLWS